MLKKHASGAVHGSTVIEKAGEAFFNTFIESLQISSLSG